MLAFPGYMVHIGIDARATYYSKGGIGVYVRSLIDGLAEVDRNNRYTIFHSRKDQAPRRITRNFDQRPVWTPAHHRFEQWTFALEVAVSAPDLLHSPDFIPPFVRNYKSVITIHDLAFL